MSQEMKAPVLRLKDFVTNKVFADFTIPVIKGHLITNVHTHDVVTKMTGALAEAGYIFNLRSSYVRAYSADGLIVPMSELDHTGVIYNQSSGELHAIVTDPTVTGLVVRIPLEKVAGD